MYIVAKHEISDPAKFWATAQEAMPQLPADVKLLQVFPSTNGSAAVCLWEADSVDKVRDVVDSSVGDVSRNEFYEVDAKNAVGLPA